MGMMGASFGITRRPMYRLPIVGTPVTSRCSLPQTNRVYFAGKGGTIYYRDNPDSANGTVTQLASSEAWRITNRTS